MSVVSTQAGPATMTTFGESPQTAEDFVHTIEILLDEEQFAAAQRMAARAADSFADHPWLAKAHRVLNPKRVTSHPARGSDRKKEFDWLRRNSGAYRGKWVALLGDQLIASSDAAGDVLREIRARNLEARPLVHRVE